MYKKVTQSWLKHLDFLILDILSLELAFLIANFIRLGVNNPYDSLVYRNTAIVMAFTCFFIAVTCDSYKDILKRGYYKEFKGTLRDCLYVMLVVVLYLFGTQTGQIISRIVIFLTTVLFVIFTYSFRLVRKKLLKDSATREGNRSLLIITNSKKVSKSIKNIVNNNFHTYKIAGVCLIDKDLVGEEIDGIKVVANVDNVIEFICKNWVDEVFINLPKSVLLPKHVSEQLRQIGVVLHTRIAKETDTIGRKQFVDQLGEYTVLTTTMNYADPLSLFIKRSIDILGGLVGCLICAVIYIFYALIIKKVSPGPVFFVQPRVGKNGKVFKFYKFRSMYLDAEERKKELLEKNKLKDNFMFKLDEDPRIIGSKVLEDGTYKKGVGNFIRDYSLDEFPQFFSVLKGDMSLVGTRPPLLDEVSNYAPYHFQRLASRPGITGMWQVSGRSNITDFNEVVRLDTEYINTWDIGLDIKILLLTIQKVFKKEGSA